MPEDRAAALVAQLTERFAAETPWLSSPARVQRCVVARLHRMAGRGDWVALVALHRHYRQHQPEPSATASQVDTSPPCHQTVTNRR